MTREEMYKIGQKTHAIGWTDAELDQQIEALKLVIAYLGGFGNSGIVITTLADHLYSFERMKRVREQGH